MMRKWIFELLPYIICTLFFIAYTTLSLVRHQHYQSFGYDLGINDQVVWKYSQLNTPITSIDHAPLTSKLDVHIEIIYAILSPFYWLWSDPQMLLILQAGFISFSGIAIYFLAKYYKLHLLLQYALLINYLLFYGIQNALWFDAHSSPFAAAFTSWFLLCLVNKKIKWATLFFLLSITAKENIALRTFFIGIIYTITTRNKTGIYFAAASLTYLVFTFGIYFPNFVTGGYRFDNPGGLFSNLNPMFMINTNEKLHVYLYTFLSYGFLALLNPLYLLPVLGNLATYFVFGSNVTTAQGLFLHYRVGLAPLMSWATIGAIAKYKWLNTKYIAFYLILCALIVQYTLHLPLSYLTKQWFWEKSSGVQNIQEIVTTSLPKNASLVAQNNIVPHVSHRYEIYSLFPEKRVFLQNSPCGKKECAWFGWFDNPQFLFVDTSQDWDIRHLLATREDFLAGLRNMEKAKVISIYKRVGSAMLYTVNKRP